MAGASDISFRESVRLPFAKFKRLLMFMDKRKQLSIIIDNLIKMFEENCSQYEVDTIVGRTTGIHLTVILFYIKDTDWFVELTVDNISTVGTNYMVSVYHLNHAVFRTFGNSSLYHRVIMHNQFRGSKFAEITNTLIRALPIKERK